MRIAIGSFWQETLPFNPVPTTLQHFQAFGGIVYGEQLLEQPPDVGDFGGFLQAAQFATDVELIPTMRAGAWPGGLCDSETHQWLKQRFLTALQNAGPIDGILLDLHGAMSAEDEYDVEGDLLATIRAKWGPIIPIAVSLDHHANITKRIVYSTDIIVGYHTSPHVDMVETGYKTATLLFAMVRGQLRPTMGWRKIPMMLYGDLCTLPGHPLAKFFQNAKTLEQQRPILSVSIFPVQSLDTPEMGWDVIVVTNNEPSLAQQHANQIAQRLWESRERFLPKYEATPIEAVQQAMSIPGGPIVLSDRADATNSGANGDSTAILRALLNVSLEDPALLTIVDPEAVEHAIRAGIDRTVTLSVGGKFYTRNNPSVTVTGRVTNITDGRFVITSPMGKGATFSLGQTVVLAVNNVHIVLSERAGPGHDPSLYRSVGLEPQHAKIVVVKSPFGFRAAYEPFAQSIIIVDGPGAATSHVHSLNYKHLNRPIYPLDEDTTFTLD